MPRIKKTESASVSASVAKAKKIKKPVKKSAPIKKAKPVIIDVIEDDDDDIIDSSNFFSDESLAKNNFSHFDKSSVRTEDTDIQKKFFSDLVSEIKNKEDVSKHNKFVDGESKLPPKKSLGLYRRLAWKFLIMVGLLAILVFYFSFSKLTILITPQVEAMSDTLFMRVGESSNEIAEAGDFREKVSGAVSEFVVEVEKKYPATGEEMLGEELSGKVVIINNYIKGQQLIATTRLLSSDNKLFRIKESVNIPAGGKVEVEIYADKISAEMAIGPSHFTIPGLWAGLQYKIYAESETAFTYGEKAQKYVKASDIQSATDDINNLILEKSEKNKTLRSQDEVLYQILEVSDMNIGAQIKDKVDEFTVKAKARVVSVTFSKDEAAKLASAKLGLLVPDDKKLAEFKPDSLSYALENYDGKNKLATVKASFSGLMVLKSNADIIDKTRLVNLNAQQISSYLSDYPEIGNYELKFYPSFVKRAPNLVDRIEVKIKD